MPKPKVRLTVTLPDYPEKHSISAGRKPGMAWRGGIYEAIRLAAEKQGVESYSDGAEIECDIRLALSATRLGLQDVDNLLKHIFDAMQGRIGGPKAKPRSWHILPNDYQIRRVTVEKVEGPQRTSGSRLIVTDYAKNQRLQARRKTAIQLELVQQRRRKTVINGGT